MAQDFIRYDLHVQDALRGVVRRVLTDVVRDGLPGEHHFYITFHTQHPGVRLSNRMRAEYPTEMTIVLQHQFWDLTVTEQAFEVGLSFKGVPEKLLVPFEALTGFFDRSVDFGLRFESGVDIDDEDDADDSDDDEEETGQVTQGVFPRRVFEVASSNNADEVTGATSSSEEATSAPDAENAVTKNQGEEPSSKADADDASENEIEHTGAQVVRLDAFRKKNT